MEQKVWSYVTAMMDYFGKRPGQSTADFAVDLKALTEADKAELKAELVRVGYKLA